MKNKLLATLVLAAMLASPPAATADDDDYIYCVYKEFSHIDEDERRAFYTAVFLGDYSFTVGYTNDFRAYLDQEYDFNGIEEYCFFENDSPTASRALKRAMEDDERSDLYDGGVIMTNWAPDSFSKQPLQDFNISIRGESADLKICVRDHECEDGDKVRVSVDDLRIFSGEIDNDWDCSRVEVEAGRKYAIELYAVNGSGQKGNCSYADVNTGEIRIEGATTETQSWRHRGGAGSRARIVVESR